MNRYFVCDRRQGGVWRLATSLVLQPSDPKCTGDTRPCVSDTQRAFPGSDKKRCGVVTVKSRLTTSNYSDYYQSDLYGCVYRFDVSSKRPGRWTHGEVRQIIDKEELYEFDTDGDGIDDDAVEIRQSSNHAIDWTNHEGWYLNLQYLLPEGEQIAVCFAGP